LNPGERKTITVDIALDVSKVTDRVSEVDALLKLMSGPEEIHRIPVIAIVKKISQVTATGLKVRADSEASGAGAVAELNLQNKGVNSGLALPFNLLGVDQRKQDSHNDSFLSRACDLQAAGYRLVNKNVDGQNIQVLQIGFKVYEPMTTWNSCEVSLLIDSNGDQIADQELAGMQLGNLAGASTATNANKFASVLLDAPKARELRSQFEQKAMSGDNKIKEDYSAAVIDAQGMMNFDHSSVVVIEADVTKLAKNPAGVLSVKLATIFNEASSVEMDDYLGTGVSGWRTISLDSASQSFVGLPESVTVASGQGAKVDFTKGESSAKLLMLFPDNRGVFSDVQKDDQLQILKPSFGF
jgi:hypothetical protein